MKKVGRPLAFDPDEALERAMRLFWERGYEGTSLSDLTGAMGISRPSLYAAFGNKEALFRRACERYMAGAKDSRVPDGLTAREAAEAFLRQGASPSLEVPGCMLVTAALAGGEESATVRRELCAIRNGVVEAWADRLAAAEASGEPLPAPPMDLARFLMAVSNGLTVLARGGAAPDELGRVVDVAMAAWPEGTRSV